ncbi:hypothetical protein B7463_g5252, partial [Scytalidium lignicola]
MSPNRRIGWINPPDAGENEGLLQCQFCYTEFKVDYAKLNGGRTSMFCTVWQDLGEGESYLDPHWQSYIPSKDQTLVEFEPGSIYSAFEKGDNFKFNELVNPEEEDGLVQIDNAMSSNNIDEVRKAITRFFSRIPVHTWYAGSKNPVELYQDAIENSTSPFLFGRDLVHRREIGHRHLLSRYDLQ